MKVNEVTYCKVPADDISIAYVGRVVHLSTGSVEFCLPGVQIHARFSGSHVAMDITPGCGYFMVELDDIVPYKVECHESDTVTEIASGLPCKEHTLTLTYCNEGEIAHPVFNGLLVDSDGRMATPPELYSRKIEFIGDSITCGYGNEDTSADKIFPYPDVNNAYFSFAMQVSRCVHAQCVLVARSGICLHYDRFVPGVTRFYSMHKCYPYTLLTNDPCAHVWDSNNYIPDVVCINLGTNDALFPAFDKNELAHSFVHFVHELRRRYPWAKVVLVSGPMTADIELGDIVYAQNKAFEILKNEGELQIYRFDFTPDDGSMCYGTGEHPSLGRHVSMASELTQFLKEIMAW